MELASSVAAVDPSPRGLPSRSRWGFWATLGWSVPIVAVMMLSQTLGAIGFVRLWRVLKRALLATAGLRCRIECTHWLTDR